MTERCDMQAQKRLRQMESGWKEKWKAVKNMIKQNEQNARKKELKENEGVETKAKKEEKVRVTKVIRYADDIMIQWEMKRAKRSGKKVKKQANCQKSRYQKSRYLKNEYL